MLGAAGWNGWRAAQRLEATGVLVRSEVSLAQHDVRTHDLTGLAQVLSPLGRHLAILRGDLAAAAMVSRWPVLGPYYRNTWRLVTGAEDTVAAAEIGLRSIGVTASGDPGMRLGAPLLTALGDLARAQQTWSRVNPQHLPTLLTASGTLAVKAASAFTLLSTLNRQRRALGQAAGLTGPASWLLILQDSGELRASGGFLAGCGVVTVDHGQVTGAAVQGIQQCSSGIRLSWPPPWLLRHFFGARTWALLNINLSPDVPTTARRILTLYDSKPHAPRVVGVAFVDTWMVQQLVGLLGPITIAGPTGQPVVLTAANVYQEMLSFAEQTYYPGQPRKQFLNAIVKALVARIRHATLPQRLRILHAVALDLAQKDLMFYLPNRGGEAVLNQLDWGGAVIRAVSNDYLMVVDENFGAHKDNEYLTERVSTTIRRVGSRTEETTRVTLSMPQPANWWLTVPYQGWVSLYVPRGATLISVTGDSPTIVRTKVDTRLNKTVIGCAVRVPTPAGAGSPPVSRTVTISYWLPSGVSTRQLTIQKQPGVQRIRFSVAAGTWTRSWILTQDVTVALP